MHDKPLAVLPVSGHGHVFDYVSTGAAVGLDTVPNSDSLNQSRSPEQRQKGAAKRLQKKYLENLGSSTQQVVKMSKSKFNCCT